MACVPASGHFLFILQGTGGQIDLAANDRFDPCGQRVLIKLNCRIEIAMIRDRYCRHAQLCGARNKGLGPHRRIQSGILGVNMEMNEGRRGHICCWAMPV